MYLYRKHYVQNWDHNPEKWLVTVQRDGTSLDVAQLDPAKVCYVTEQVAYWRKANQVHAWFVANVQGGKDECQESPLGTRELRELLEDTRTVLADHGKAAALLPTQGGSFFGSTDYDEYYFKDLEDTERQIAPLVLDKYKDYGPSFDGFYYRSSW
jgi:hypothetical protein